MISHAHTFTTSHSHTLTTVHCSGEKGHAATHGKTVTINTQTHAHTQAQTQTQTHTHTLSLSLSFSLSLSHTHTRTDSSPLLRLKSLSLFPALSLFLTHTLTHTFFSLFLSLSHTNTHTQTHIHTHNSPLLGWKRPGCYSRKSGHYKHNEGAEEQNDHHFRALCYSVLQCVLQCVAVYCSVLQGQRSSTIITFELYVVECCMCCRVLQYVAVCYSERVVSHIWMSDVIHVNELCHTCE